MSRVLAVLLPRSPGGWILWGLAFLALVLVGVRFAHGLGAVTNLSDAYPWGFWIAVDVLIGIALASGGFVMAGVVHLFGRERYHPLVRPAILTALLGYLLFIAALAVDLGRPWHIWRALISWNHHSPMFEVAWCVMLYTTVLILEFAPAVLERLGLGRALAWWREGVPWVVVAMLTLFSYAMTLSPVWAGLTFGLLVLWEGLMRAGVMPRDRQMPILLILAGVTLSTLHQSSLGTLFLAVDRLADPWQTPILPVLFFLSAVMVAPAVVILEATFGARAMGRRPEQPLLMGLAGAMPYLLGVYLAVRLGDVVVRGVVFPLLEPSVLSGWWWLEILLLLSAWVLFSLPELRWRRNGLVLPAFLTVLGLVTHRLGVALVGISVPGAPAYVPAWSEIAITAGLLAAGLLAFRILAEVLPVYGEEPESQAREARAGGDGAGRLPAAGMDGGRRQALAAESASG